MSEIDLHTSIEILCAFYGFCLGNIFQILMRKNKNKDE